MRVLQERCRSRRRLDYLGRPRTVLVGPSQCLRAEIARWLVLVEKVTKLRVPTRRATCHPFNTVSSTGPRI